MKFSQLLISMVMVHLISEPAYAENGGAKPLDIEKAKEENYHKTLLTISWLQNFADGYWVLGRDLSCLDKSKFGTRSMLPEEARHLARNVKHLKPIWEGMAIFLRGYRYDEVDKVWDELAAKSIQDGTYDKVFRMAIDQTTDGVQSFKTTSIRRLHLLAKDDK
ncbi:MAG: hypothetical protein WCL39_14915 [Armatimonadota bacterium]